MRIFICVVVLVWFILPLSAQVEGRLTGSVVDAEGESVTNATVSLSLPGSAAPVLETVTTSDGIFILPGVRPDFYDLRVTVPGYQVYTLRNLKIDPARETSLPAIALTAEQITLTVDVSAPLQTVQTRDAAVTTTITNEQVRRLPLIDRIALPLVRTQVGVSDAGNINGQRSSSVNVTLDGINIRDNYIRDNDFFTPNLIVLDQVAELTVTTAIANASQGGGSSQINVVTPSGGRDFHGAAYFYNRNNALAANSWFNNKERIEKPGFNQNQLGVTFAGPIKRDKLLFYTNYEAYRLGIHPTTVGTILTQDARDGVFTYEDTAGQVRKVNILQAAGVSPDPAMQQILAAVPGPEKINSFRAGDSRESLLRNTAGYSFVRQGHHNRDNATFKLDYNLSTTNTFTGSFVWNRQDVTRSDLSNDFSTVPKVHQNDKRKLLSLGWRWNPRPTFTNEIRGGFNLAPITFETDEKFGERLIANTIYSNPVNLFRATGRGTNTFDFMDNAAWSRGAHALQWGFQTEQIRIRTYDDSGITPTYFLGLGFAGLSETQLPGVRASDLPVANALLATLAGFVNSYSQTFNITDRSSGFVNGASSVRHLRLNNYAFYLQDAWKPARRLSLNVGIRYELPSVVDERDSLYLSPRVENNDPVKTLLSNATLDFAGSAAGRPLYARDKNNVSPNVGLAWDVSGDGRMSVRAGYSINYLNDETVRAIQNYISFNEGVIAISSRINFNSRVSAGLPSIPTPVFKVPRTFSENFSQNPFTAFGMPDSNLRTPYAQQWTVGIQREVGGSILEVRYVGNHATKLFRGFDVNPEVTQENGFLNDFNRARNNGTLARAATGVFDPSYNPNIAGSQPLPVFNSLAAGGLLSNAFVRNLIQSGQAGELAVQYYLANLAGSVQFYRNPVSLASLLLNNYSNTSYNALQIDLLRRFRKRVQFQANYTYGKVLSDSDGTASHRFEEFRNPYNGKIDRSRPTFDVTHAIKGNAVYDLPYGGEGWRRHVLGGWAVSGIMTWQSGNPFSILSKRGTLIRAQRSSQNTASSALTKDQLDQVLQFRMTNNGPFIVAASAVGSDGRGVAPDGSAPFAGQAFLNPNAGEIGGLQRRWFSGPWRFDFDLGVLKKFQFHETHSLEFRLEALNALNHPTWSVPDQDINSVSFGRLQSTANEARKLQLSLRYQF